jgi:hypothetical protein
MKVFISWSGPRSRAVAEALNDWLRRVIQAVKPFYSPEIEKGAKWSSEVDEALEGTRFGIICLTPDNLQSPWIHYEAGALSKTKDALIWTFLHGLTPGDVPPPLGKFQHTVAEKPDVLLLLKTINSRLADVGGEPLPDRLLEENFGLFWPSLEEKLKAAEKISPLTKPQAQKSAVERVRDERAILKEILELVRNQERRMLDFEDRLSMIKSPRSKSSLVERAPYNNVDVFIRKEEGTDKQEIERAVDFFKSVLSPPPKKIIVENNLTESLISIDLNRPMNRDELQRLLNLLVAHTGVTINDWLGH